MLAILEMRPPEKSGDGLNHPIEGNLQAPVKTSVSPF